MKDLTIYAFSVDNFQRSEVEVKTLMELAAYKFNKLAMEKKFLMKHNIRVKILGKLELLPEKVTEAMSKVVELTKSNTG